MPKGPRWRTWRELGDGRTLICFGVSVMKIAELGFEDDILPPGPCRAVRNLEWISAGFGDGFFIRDALSLNRRK